MPDEGNGQSQDATQQNTQAATTATADQVQNMNGMAMAFDDPSLVVNPGDTSVANTNTAVITQPAAATEDAASTPDYTPFVKETFGVETIEEAKAQWQELQALKNAPPKAEEIKFENEESKTVHELLRQGKTKEAIEFYSKQDKLNAAITSEINKETASDIIKLNMQLKYPKLTPTQIDFQYKQEYGIPKEPVMKDTEDETEFNERHEAWKDQVQSIQMKTEIAATMAIPELEKAKSNLKLPDIPAGKVDEDYEAYKASNASADEAYNNITVPGIKSLKETDVQLGFKVEDANNQMQFEVALVPTKEDFEKARQDSLSLTQFLTKVAYDKDGKFLPHRLQRMVLLEQNFDNYAQSIARQAVNEERKRVIAKEAPNGNGSKDYNVNTDKTELQKQMEYSLS